MLKLSTGRPRGRPRKIPRTDANTFDDGIKLEMQSEFGDEQDQRDIWPSSTPDTTNKKKATHLRCERQRRDAINSGYNELKGLLPQSLANMGCKTTNASILFRAAEYLCQLEKRNVTTQTELDQLNAEKQTLLLIHEQYESIARVKQEENNRRAYSHQQNTPADKQNAVLAAAFDQLLQSFQSQVHVDDHATLVKTLVAWIEQQDVTGLVLRLYEQQNAHINMNRPKFY